MTKRPMFFAVSLLTLSAGCDHGAEELVKATEAYAASACLCKDAACFTKAASDHSAATAPVYAKLYAGKVAPRPSDKQKIQDSLDRVATCMDAMRADAGSGESGAAR